ncbi:MAG: ABC transporter ATP-binding protein [Emcibacter sp.]|nr:ABC transporter ATP-binding protein [Emcibacter sp.]
MKPNIELISVTKEYGRTKAVDVIDFSVLAGECLALVGHNGAGKSTLIKMVLGLTSPTRGTVNVFGYNPSHIAFSQMRKKIGFLPEQVLFQNNMTGRETLEFYSRLKGVACDDLNDLFRRVDLFQAADDRIGTYSKGMRQRLGLAQALIGSPKLLILDEPTSGLDPSSRQNVYGIIHEMKQAGVTILLSSHALTELDDRIDRVAIVNKGHLTAVGTIPNLRHNIGLAAEIIIYGTDISMQSLAQHFSNRFSADCFEYNVAHLHCPMNEKVALLKEIMALNISFTNIEINDPSLEQVFMAYTKAKEPVYA